jgi:CTP synthase
MRLEEGFDNTLYVHIALVPILGVTNEMKTKPLQHSVNELRRIGIQPDIIVARCSKMINSEALRKIALFGTIPEKAVFCSYDVKTIYQVPLILDQQGMGEFISNRLKLSNPTPKYQNWKKFVDGVLHPAHTVKIALIGKYSGLTDSYVSMNEAFRHAGAALNTHVNIKFLEAETLENVPNIPNILNEFDGVFVPYGFGPRGTEGKIRAINFAREQNVPFLGICYGFQLAVIEFARNVCQIKGASSVEIEKDTPNPVIDLMPEQRKIETKGATMRLGSHQILIKPKTLAFKLYGTAAIAQRHRHRYEVNLDYLNRLTESGLIFSGKSTDGRRMEILELPDRIFFFASQFHGEFRSRPKKPDPEYYGFIKACRDKKFK